MKPFLSVVVISYKSGRELPRTLFSLSPQYQRDIAASDYEVIVVDNGSPEPPHASQFAHLGIDLRVISNPNPTHSPVAAMNLGLNQSFGQVVCAYIDGARIASPGLLAEALKVLEGDARAVVGSRGRYLGPELQRNSMLKGYDQRTEDMLLQKVEWEANGYRLFDVSVWDESSSNAWFGNVYESNSLFMSRQLWSEVGGFDRAFQTPGGGLANLDTWSRACALPDVRPTLLLGEATFHQFHGGVATNVPEEQVNVFLDEYRQIRGRTYSPPDGELHFSGMFHWSSSAAASWDTMPLADYIRRTHRNAKVKKVARKVGRRVPVRLRRPIFEVVRFGRLLTTRQLAVWRTEREAVREVRASEHFDAAWYRNRYPDVAAAKYPPALHYVRFGLLQHRQPSAGFDAVKYLEQHAAEMTPGQNPVLHYERIGRAAGLAVSPVAD